MRRAWLLLFVGTAWGQTAVPDTPFLRIETGMHTANVSRIDTDTAERYLVSASDDKTARVWDLRTGQLLTILRPPQGNDPEGKLYAVAISPDGSTVAVGGYTRKSEHPVYFFDRATGVITRSISGFPQPVFHLAYSQDGQRIAIALGGAHGIRIYDTGDYSEVARDTAYRDT